jgi:hypothetical protein
MISDKTDLRIFPPAFLCGFRARLARRMRGIWEIRLKHRSPERELGFNKNRGSLAIGGFPSCCRANLGITAVPRIPRRRLMHPVASS